MEKRLNHTLENIALQKEGLRLTNVRFKNGLVPELDVTQARSLLRSTQSLVPRLEAQINRVQNALSILLGKAPGDLAVLLDKTKSALIPKAPAVVAVGAPVDLLRRRPDVKKAEYDAAAQSALIGVAKSKLYPQFTLIGNIGLSASSQGGAQSNNSEFGDLFSGSSVSYVVGPTINWSFLNYGRIKNQTRVEDARFQQLIINYQNTVLNAAREVEDSLDAFLKEKLAAAALTESVSNAEKSVSLATERYKSGLVSYQRVIDTQRFLVQQQDRATEAQGNIALHLVATYKALGGGWNTSQTGPNLAPDLVRQMKNRTDWGNILEAGQPKSTKPGSLHEK